ncbi:hypothetical protein [Aquimarina sp. I32.4]|uniref:hypothetical protein n=1 Tax=Aquimarina sp. I32.4 TaxID=2053903 RepID=UPI000CDF129D|nr:hypothetical protein [Aquimarina sp. I32.4]
MGISQELLKRYVANKCTSSEKEQIENWLDTNYNEEELEYVFSFHFSRDKVLKNIYKDIDEEYPISNSIQRIFSSSTCRMITKISIAACLALVFYFTGDLFSNSFEKQRNEEIAKIDSSEQEPTLYVSTINSKSQKVTVDRYGINFEGSIRLFNETQKEQVVTCNGVEIVLQSNKAVYLMSSPSNGFYKLNNPLAFDNFSGDEIPSKYYKICLKS